MASVRRRVGWLRVGAGLLLAVGLCAVLLHLFAARGEGPDGITPLGDSARARDVRAELTASRTGDASPTAVLSAPPQPQAFAASASSPAGTTAPIVEALTAAAFAGAAAIVHVTLRLPDAWSGRLYALPAGQPGPSDAGEQDLPHVAISAGADEATLPLPREGAWDIGFVGICGHVLLQGVEVRGTTEVVLDAPGALPVRFRVGGPPGPAPRGRVWLRSGTSEEVNYPGRGQHTCVSFEQEIGDAPEIVTPPMAPGVEYRVRCASPPGMTSPAGAPGVEWRASHATARAGDEVDLLLKPMGLVRVALEVTPPLPESWRAHWPTDLWIAALARAEGDEEARHVAGTLLRKDGTFQQDVLLLPLAPGRYAFAMTPEPVVFQNSSRSIEVRAGQTLDIRVRATPDAARAPFSNAAQVQPAAFGTHVMLEFGAPPRHGWWLSAELKDNDTIYWGEHGGRAGEMEVASTDPIRRALLVLPPDRASDVFVPPASGTVRVTLKPAGTLVVVPEVTPDPGLGALRLRRVDGVPLPLLRAGDEYDVDFLEQPEVKLGTVLGPLPEGRLSLEVLLGGVVIDRPVAEVRAGRHTPLVIPLPTGPSR
jgi:hypothetical protein